MCLAVTSSQLKMTPVEIKERLSSDSSPSSVSLCRCSRFITHNSGEMRVITTINASTPITKFKFVVMSLVLLVSLVIEKM